MFEKSLYDLIRGLRNHKGNERAYIQDCLKECRAEIRGADMDTKATALLKLVYLEMIGFDMSWAAFHVLEVMSSAKFRQKRVGYLAAAQSFRSDTDVLMLATNQIKKDLAATAVPVMTLPIVTLPHLLNPSLAMSTQTDLLPRLTHSNPNVRKKTIVTLYRMALVYPETLVLAWPRIKDRLMDKNEDSSVTAAIVSIITELAWRRPKGLFCHWRQGCLSCWSRGGNNWMAIKLIKLFATLTPLEPRLVRKLLPPLTDLIRETPAMSLLYECINGIIQGGILESDGEEAGREEIANLCVEKLRSMITMKDRDPNLKYVALLAFNKIVETHPWLVAQQQDVILDCIDNPDITIRFQALDLAAGMVTSDSLVTIVGRLMRQLKASKTTTEAATSEADASDSDSGQAKTPKDQEPPLPEDYQIDMIGKMLTMCSQNNYQNIDDFHWYLDVLSQLVRLAPAPKNEGGDDTAKSPANVVVARIGSEVRNVAVKVRAMRPDAVRSAERIVTEIVMGSAGGAMIVCPVLVPLAWMMGEYPESLESPEDTLNSLLLAMPRTNSPDILMTVLQSVVKLLSAMTASEMGGWSAARKTMVSLLLSRVLHAFEPLTGHPSLEVQERAVQFVELLKLTAEAVSGHAPSTDELEQDPPLLLTQAIPSLFSGWELKSMSATAQRNVPLPVDLDLNEPIHPNLAALLDQANVVALQEREPDEWDLYYHQKAAPTAISSQSVSKMRPAIEALEGGGADDFSSSYQQTESDYLDPDIVARRKAERAAKNKDDPFYIGATPDRSATPIGSILKSSNGTALDIDDIPVMPLDLAGTVPGKKVTSVKAPPAKPRVTVAVDDDLSAAPSANVTPPAKGKKKSSKGLGGGLLHVDSAALSSLSLTAEPKVLGSYEEDTEMAKAMKEVERARLRMERDSERVNAAEGVDLAGVVVSKKKKKGKKKEKTTEGGEEKEKKKKKKKKVEGKEETV